MAKRSRQLTGKRHPLRAQYRSAHPNAELQRSQCERAPTALAPGTKACVARCDERIRGQASVDFGGRPALGREALVPEGVHLDIALSQKGPLDVGVCRRQAACDVERVWWRCTRNGWRSTSKVVRGIRAPCWEYARGIVGGPVTRDARRYGRVRDFELVSPIGSFPGTAGNMREEPRKHWGLGGRRSRLFPAVLGTRDRKSTAAKALRSSARTEHEPGVGELVIRSSDGLSRIAG
jgi:hypothetical protein